MGMMHTDPAKACVLQGASITNCDSNAVGIRICYNVYWKWIVLSLAGVNKTLE